MVVKCLSVESDQRSLARTALPNGALAGLLVLTVRRWAAAVAIVLLIADVAGRIALTATGLYPTGSLLNTVAIIAGTALWPNMYCLTAAGSTSASHTFAADALTPDGLLRNEPLTHLKFGPP